MGGWSGQEIGARQRAVPRATHARRRSTRHVTTIPAAHTRCATGNGSWRLKRRGTARRQPDGTDKAGTGFVGDVSPAEGPSAGETGGETVAANVTLEISRVPVNGYGRPRDIHFGRTRAGHQAMKNHGGTQAGWWGCGVWAPGRCHESGELIRGRPRERASLFRGQVNTPARVDAELALFQHVQKKSAHAKRVPIIERRREKPRC